MMYFRVKTGYGTDDFLSVDETEVGQFLRAQINGGVAVSREGTVSGPHIMTITPDYNRALGYNRDYRLTGEDYEELPSSVQRAHVELLEETKRKALGTNNNDRLTDGS